MNIRTFIHIALIAVMLFSQLISTMHVAGHLHADEHAIVAHAECELPHSVLSFNDSFASAATESARRGHADATGGFGSDCSIYHVYTGLSGFVSVDTLYYPVQTSAIDKLPAPSIQVAAIVVDSLRIRGPPSVS